MIIKYFTKVTVKFDPFTAGARPSRTFLSMLPLSIRSSCKVEYKVLTANSSAKEKPVVEVTFKDKQMIKADPEKMSFKDLAEHFDSHSRQLAIKDAISE